jgi:flagellar basal body-associated protein FliL
MAIDSIITSVRSMGKGSWVILIILLLCLVATAVVSYLGWTGATGTDVPASGYISLALGVTFSLAVGVGLMALIFYSSRAGYDEPARLVQSDDTADPQP